MFVWFERTVSSIGSIRRHGEALRRMAAHRCGEIALSWYRISASGWSKVAAAFQSRQLSVEHPSDISLM